MTLRQLPLTGSNGTAATAANTGATPTLQTSCTAVFDSTAKGVDTTGITFSTPGGTAGNNNASLRWVPSGAANASYAWEFVFTMPSAAGPGPITLWKPRMTVTPAPYVQITVDGRLQFVSTTGVGLFYLATTGAPLAWGSKYRLSIRATTGSTGMLAGTVYGSATATSPLFTGTAGSNSATGIDMGSSTFAGIDVGVIGGLSTAVSLGVSDIQMNDGSTSAIGPWVAGANQLPTVTAPSAPQSVAPGSSVSLSGFAASDSDGTIASVATTYGSPSTSQPAVTNGTSLSSAPTFTAGPAGSLYTPIRTYTDNSGGTAAGATEVRVPADTNLSALAVAATKSGSVTRTGGSTDGGALADSDDGTYLELASGASFTIRATPVKTQTSYAVTFRLATPGAGTAVCTLYQGSYAPNGTPTLTQVQASSALTLTTTPTDYQLAVNNPGSIVDWGCLYIGVTSS